MAAALKPGVPSAFLPASPLIFVILWSLGAESSLRVLRASVRQPGLGEIPPCVQCLLCQVPRDGSQGAGAPIRGAGGVGDSIDRESQCSSCCFLYPEEPRPPRSILRGVLPNHEYSSSCSVARTAVTAIPSSYTSRRRCLAQSLVVVLSHPAGD